MVDFFFLIPRLMRKNSFNLLFIELLYPARNNDFEAKSCLNLQRLVNIAVFFAVLFPSIKEDEERTPFFEHFLNNLLTVDFLYDFLH